MLSRFRRFRRYLQARGVRETAVAVGHRLLGLAYTEERLIVMVKDLDSIVESWRNGDVCLDDLGAGHLSEPLRAEP